MVGRREGAVLLALCLLALLGQGAGLRRLTGRLKRPPSAKVLRTVQGVAAQKLQYPFQVNIRTTNNESTSYCGGVVLDRKYVLTASHCVKGLEVVEVIAGVVDMSDVDNRVTRKVRQVEMYPRHSNEDIVNDIAMLELEPPLPAGHPGIETIRVRRYATRSGKNCVLVGWTATQNGNSHLEAQEAPLWPETICRALHPTLKMDTVCSGNAAKNAENCMADPGSSLVCNGLLVGTASIGLPCHSPGQPQSFTDLSYFYDWLGRAMHNTDAVFENGSGSGDGDGDDEED